MTLLKSRKACVIAVMFLVLGASAAGGEEFKRSAFIVLKGIDPDVSPEKMKEAAAFLSTIKIPFGIGIRPIIYGAGSRRVLSDNPYLVKNIKSLSIGGTFLLQRTLPFDESMLDEEIDELVKNDILPLAFLDIPSVMESKNYDAISDHFSTIVRGGRPGLLTDDSRFQTVINLGYRFGKEKMRAGQLNTNAVFGVIIDVDFEKKELLKFVKYLKGLGFTFMNLKDKPNYVRSDDVIIVSNAWYYARLPLGDVAYGLRKKLDLIKFKLKDSYLVERSLDRAFAPISEKVMDMKLTGTALVDIPYGTPVFLVKQSPIKPSAVERFGKIASVILFGKQSAGRLEDLFRLVIIVLFLITGIVTMYILVMFTRAVMSGKHYQEF